MLYAVVCRSCDVSYEDTVAPVICSHCESRDIGVTQLEDSTPYVAGSNATIQKFINPCSPYHGMFYVLAHRAFRANMYLHKDGQWTEDDTSCGGMAYFDTPEEASRVLAENPCNW